MFGWSGNQTFFSRQKFVIMWFSFVRFFMSIYRLSSIEEVTEVSQHNLYLRYNLHYNTYRCFLFVIWDKPVNCIQIGKGKWKNLIKLRKWEEYNKAQKMSFMWITEITVVQNIQCISKSSSIVLRNSMVLNCIKVIAWTKI